MHRETFLGRKLVWLQKWEMDWCCGVVYSRFWAFLAAEDTRMIYICYKKPMAIGLCWMSPVIDQSRVYNSRSYLPAGSLVYICWPVYFCLVTNHIIDMSVVDPARDRGILPMGKYVRPDLSKEELRGRKGFVRPCLIYISRQLTIICQRQSPWELYGVATDSAAAKDWTWFKLCYGAAIH